ncbi:flagellin [Acutalibacter caecimuris]|uniref:flagellin N-terminal helical domain-containing protein n=1 Tax=Acutalibacter caecimuris TaxID=3093657 RepID=UPI002AC8FEC3|nr:flagellin [Acutalibacter sp. M00118]
MRIQHNIMSMNAYRNYNNNASSLSKNLEKLSSGYKINRAGDDAAGLAISEKMRAQIKGLEAATKNVKDGINLVKTAEGALQEVQDMLSRMKYLATQSSNGTYENEVDRENLQLEVDKLKDEIDRIADSANFNGIKLLDGTIGGRELGSAIDAAVGNANSILSIDVSGGGATVAANATKLNFALTASGTLKLSASAALTGLKIQYKDSNGSWVDGSSQAASFDISGASFTGGSFTFRIVRDSNFASVATTAADANVRSYEGMTFTVRVDGGKIANGVRTDSFAAFASTTIAFGDQKGLGLRIGDTADDFNGLTVDVKDMHVKAMGIDNVDIGTAGGADDAIEAVKNAINYVSKVRGELGATQNRLEHTQNNLSVMTENITDAESGIRDTDVADEMMAYTKNNILIQSAQAMLAQANAVPQGVLQLLQ